MKAGGAHILVIPYPAQGHMIPFISLTQQLAIRGLTITILVTPENQAILKPLLANHSSVQTLVLPFPSCPNIPPGVENLKDMIPTKSRSILMDMTCALHGLHDTIIEWFQTHPSPPVAIISDMFLGWTYGLACTLGIRRYVFSTSGVLAFSVMHTLWLEKKSLKVVNDDTEIVSFPMIPNKPKYPWWQILPAYRRYVENNGQEYGEDFRDWLLCNLKSDGLIINSFDVLEGVYVDYLKKEMGLERIWCIGPILDSSGPISRHGSSLDMISLWLDNCEEDSVLYVCFGSQHICTRKQIEVLTLGLEKSGVKFIWVQGRVEGDDGTIPIEFEDRVAGRGLIVKEWAPQVLILNHPSIGGFLTHCGWNSTLESIVAGVSMLTWPMNGDQFDDATLLVDDLKVAIRVGEGVRNIPNPNDFADMVGKMMGTDYVEKRLKAKELKNASLEAIKECGSSWKNLDNFVLQLSQNHVNE